MPKRFVNIFLYTKNDISQGLHVSKEKKKIKIKNKKKTECEWLVGRPSLITSRLDVSSLSFIQLETGRDVDIEVSRK